VRSHCLAGQKRTVYNPDQRAGVAGLRAELSVDSTPYLTAGPPFGGHQIWYAALWDGGVAICPMGRAGWQADGLRGV
jgi:hypothetical protein